MNRWKAVGLFFLIIAIGCISLWTLIATSDGGDMTQFKIKPTNNLAAKKRQKVSVDWEKLQSQNPDAYAWLYVPGTEIDYPVLQSGNVPEDYYLHHNLYRQYSFAGSIYSRRQNAKDFSDKITVLYGHNMINGSMFADIRKFEHPDFFRKHSEFFIYMPGRILRYRIVAYHVSDAEDILATYQANNDDGYKVYADKIKQSGNIRKEEKIEADDSIVTLSTCDSADSRRRLLQGVLAETQTTK